MKERKAYSHGEQQDRALWNRIVGKRVAKRLRREAQINLSQAQPTPSKQEKM